MGDDAPKTTLESLQEEVDALKQDVKWLHAKDKLDRDDLLIRLGKKQDKPEV